MFDFRNERSNPHEPWPLGNTSLSLRFIDVLIMDFMEALRISGYTNIDEAASFFIKSGVSSFIIINGRKMIRFWSGGGLFEKQELLHLFVSKKVNDKLRSGDGMIGDTVGYRDNFTGGIIASLAWQLKARKTGYFDLIEAVSWGVASGRFTFLTTGGTYREKFPGEKLLKVRELQKEYLMQIENQKDFMHQKKLPFKIGE